MTSLSTPAPIGHNQGPPLGQGGGWALYCWRQAQARQKEKILPRIATRRARRAQDLGLPYAVFNAAILDTGRWPDSLVFGLGGTLVRGMNGRVWFDRRGRHAPLRPSLEKLATLRDCRLFLLGGHPLAPGEETLRPLLEHCLAEVAETLGGRLAEAALDLEEPRPWRGPAAAGQPAEGALAALLRRHGLAPAQAILVGDGPLERQRAAAVRLPGFVPAESYFAG